MAQDLFLSPTFGLPTPESPYDLELDSDTRIVNKLNKDQFDAVKPYLPRNFDQIQSDDVVATLNGYEMKEHTVEMYQSILDILDHEYNSVVERALLKIDELKAEFLKNKDRFSEGYVMLKVVEYILEVLDDWKEDDSETTVYRRIATIFDFMFRDTRVKLVE
ncbi:hypothetical protein [Absidia glauca]|uniref:Uncharacterized protein n=1 Tax=Absidia glauca TaxID=4829 RepID=A0A163KUI6_ABSGL|nr:hypothetical protein [Absidia glauca]